MGRYIDDNELVSVRNRNNGSTSYMLPERNVKRFFAAGQTKKVPFYELSELMYTGGGEYLLKHLLVVEDADAIKELGFDVEPEYQYNEDDIRKILFNGTLDEFTDFLNFAPDGALEIAKEMAVKEFLPNTDKRKLLGAKLDFNIDKAIEIESTINTDPDREEQESKKIEEALNKKERVATPVKAGTVKPQRKAAAPNYKVVSSTEN